MGVEGGRLALALMADWAMNLCDRSEDLVVSSQRIHPNVAAPINRADRFTLNGWKKGVSLVCGLKKCERAISEYLVRIHWFTLAVGVRGGR